jgi:hypothetical protein
VSRRRDALGLSLFWAAWVGCQSRPADPPPGATPAAIAVAPPGALGARAAGLEGPAIVERPSPEPDEDPDEFPAPVPVLPGDGGVAL